MTSAFTMSYDLSTPFTLAFGIPHGWEWGVILVIGLLVFGRRLPEVGRSVGKSIVEFKKGIKGIEQEIEEESSRNSGKAQLRDDSTKAAKDAMYETAKGSSKDA